MGSGMSPTLIAAFLIFLFAASGVLVILWIAMPFSVFGIKDRLDGLKREIEKTNLLLETILERGSRRPKAGAPGKTERKEEP